MATVIKPPHKIIQNGFSIFLGGTIEMGNSEDWQYKIEEELINSNIIIFNPRRNFWDTDWKQSASDPNFRSQVEWELDALEKSDLIIMYFDPKTTSPISLLELGLFGRTGKMIVCCPEGYFRKGNVDIVCERYKIKQVRSMSEIINEVRYLSSVYK